MEEANLKDKILVCKDCKRKFIFTVNDQMFFGQKAWNAPVRCKVCRRMKKLNVALKDGVSIADKVEFSEVCDKCGRKYYTKYKRKSGEKVYCDDCWTEIKYGDKNGEKDKGVVKSQAEVGKNIS